jgi:hypothetical protein
MLYGICGYYTKLPNASQQLLMENIQGRHIDKKAGLL